MNKAESDQIVAAMRKSNKPVEYYVFPVTLFHSASAIFASASVVFTVAS